MSDRALTRALWTLFVAFLAALQLLAACSGASDGPDDRTANRPTEASGPTSGSGFVPPAGNPDVLSAWGQLETRDRWLVLADGVTPYTLNSPLFSDYAHKLRTVWIPSGAGAAAYDPDGS